MKADYHNGRNISRNTALSRYNFITGEHKNILFINSPIHHVLPYDNNYVVFCHPANENGMLLTSIEGGYYTHMRTQDETCGSVCHYVATKKGMMYEVLGSTTRKVYAGIYNPINHRSYELVLPNYFGYTHTGADDEGRLWFYENYKSTGNNEGVHDMYFLERHDPVNGDEWKKLFDNWSTFGGGQSAHFHPRVTPDRKWILFTAGEAGTGSNQLFLLDISDLKDTEGICEVL
jgi:hypothetical protein